MSNPVAAHTFDFHKVYLSQRDLAAPGAGTWSNPVTIFDGSIETSFVTAGTFSAGALTDDPSESRGIFASCVAGMAFLGNGLPDTPVYIPLPTSNSLGYWDVAQGAFTYGGALWIVLYDNNNGVVAVIKSTDSGATWIEQDPTNGPTAIAADGSKAAVQRVDKYIYVCTPSDNTRATNLAIWAFDMSTGLWGPRSAILNDPNFHSFSGDPDEWTNGLIAWPNGDFGIFYTSFDGFPVYVPLTAGVWGSPVQISGGQKFANCLMDVSLGYVHAFSYPTTKTSGFLYSTVTQSGTIVQDITSAPAGGNDGVGHCSIQGGMIFVPYDYAADNDNAVWVSNLPVVSFSKELLPVPAGEGGKPPSCAYMMFPNGYSLTLPNPLSAACPINGGTAQVGVPYSAQLIASGGTPPYTWRQIS